MPHPSPPVPVPLPRRRIGHAAATCPSSARGPWAGWAADLGEAVDDLMLDLGRDSEQRAVRRALEALVRRATRLERP